MKISSNSSEVRTPKILGLVVVALLLLFGAAFALTNIVACGVVNAAGAYDVNLNLSGVNDASCINVTHSDVSITCLGALGTSYQNINGTNASNTYGIYVAANDVNISNCLISNYTAEIYDYNEQNSNMNNDTLIENFTSNGAGLWLDDANNTILNGSNVTGYQAKLGYGIWSDPSSSGSNNNDTVANSTITDIAGQNPYALYVQKLATNWTIFNNTVMANITSGRAIFLGAASDTGNNISNNYIQANSIGLYLTGASNNTVANNVVNQTIAASVDIQADTSPVNDTFTNNTLNGSGSVIGMLLSGLKNSTVNNNTINLSTGNALEFESSSTNDSAINNTINITTSVGVLVSTGTVNTLINISGNSINGTSGNDLQVSLGSNSTFTNNSIALQSGGGVCIALSGTANNWTIYNNTMNCLVSTGRVLTWSNAGANLNFTGNVINQTGNSPFVPSAAFTNVTIDHNSITSSCQSCSLLGLDGVNFTVTKNNITGVAGSGSGQGAISTTTSLSNSTIAGNNISLGQNFGAGVVCSLATEDFNVTIANNTILTQGSGLNLSNYSGGTIYNNSITVQNESNEAGILLMSMASNSTNITLNTINSSGTNAYGINITNASTEVVFNNTIWANLTSGQGIVIDTQGNGSNITANNITAYDWVNDSNGSNNYNVSSIGNIYYLTSGAGVWTTGNGTNLTIASPPGWSTSGYGVNTTHFNPYWPLLGSDFFAWTGNSAGGGSPDVNCTLNSSIAAIIFRPTLPLPCPSTANNVYPWNQTTGFGTYQCTNNGTASGTLQVSVNQTFSNIVNVASCDNFTTNLTLTSSNQDLAGSCAALAQGASTNVSFYNNYSTCVIPLYNYTLHIRS